MEFWNQGTDCNLSCGCGNARPLIHYARPGIEPVFRCFQDTTPVVPAVEFLSHGTNPKVQFAVYKVYYYTQVHFTRLKSELHWKQKSLGFVTLSRK